MGQISQIEDEDDRREEARHSGWLPNPRPIVRRRGLRSYGVDAKDPQALQPVEPSARRLQEINDRAARREKMQADWRNALRPPDRETYWQWLLDPEVVLNVITRRER